jgi:diguanylate cyclase (GGDEF)-like protein/PAS domain S-box-containing protein
MMFTLLLGLNVRRRKAAECSLKSRLQMEQLITQVSTSFVGSSAENLQDKLAEMMALVGKELNVDRCSLLELTPNGNYMTIDHEWCRDRIESQKQHYMSMPLQNYPWLAKQILNGKYIFIPDVENLPEAAAIEKADFQRQGILTLLMIPIKPFEQIIGYLTFDHVRERRLWNDEEIAFLGVLSNILSDALKKCMMENRLYNEKERLRITLSSVGDGVIATDRQGRIESINQVAQELTGWSESEAMGKAFQEVFPIVNEYTRDPLENPVEKVLSTGHIIGLANHTLLIAKDGREIAIADSAAPIQDNLGKTYGVVLVFRDATEERSNLRKIEYLSFHDQLTGLYNRRFFEAELKRLDTSRNLPISLVIADVNGLKLTNDAFGHEAGDTLLKKAAEVIAGQCRSDDIIARIGGDEFVILLPRTGQEETKQIVKRIQNKCGEIYIGTVLLSISMGWAQKDMPDMDISEVLKQAENYMYRRKLFESQSILGTTVNMIIRTLHEKNKREEQHSQRVSEVSAEIGRAMGLKEEIIEDLRNVGMLHDIGKIAVPEDVLNKNGSLTPEEWREIQRHPEVGYRILSSVNDLAEIAEYVLAHHERWDGQGYPKGLRQKEIPLQARIMAVADAYDAMVTERTYRKTMSKAEAVEELVRNAGTQFDPEAVRIFVEAVASRI